MEDPSIRSHELLFSLEAQGTVEKGSSQRTVKMKGRHGVTPKQSSEFKLFLFNLLYLFTPLSCYTVVPP